MSLLSQTGLRVDPYIAVNFVISLLDTSSALAVGLSLAQSAIFDVALGGFSECSGLEMSMEPEEYKEGGYNGTSRQFPNRVKWSKITLKRGFGTGTTLWDWHYGYVEGRGRRRDGMIVLLDSAHLPSQTWYFQRALPVRYQGPPMNAAQNAVAIESLELVHEGVIQIPMDLTGIASTVAGAAVDTALGDL
jgi:phage tail-like protein